MNKIKRFLAWWERTSGQPRRRCPLCGENLIRNGRLLDHPPGQCINHNIEVLP